VAVRAPPLVLPKDDDGMDLPDSKRSLAGLNLTRVILIGLFILLIAAFYFSGLSEYSKWDTLKAKRDEWREIVYYNWYAALVIFLCLSVTLMSLSLPVGSILSLTAGALFDFWVGVGTITVASAIGSTLAFLISRYLLRDFVRYWFGRWLHIVDRGIERDGARYLLMLRLSPVVPFFAVNATMGLTHMKLRTYFVVTLIGMLPSCFLYVMVGTQIMFIQSPQDILSLKLIVLLSLLALTPVLFGWVMRRIRKSEPKSEPMPVESQS
jgi:uncharacterized membrane protein YdjX (TVP38/TMEM64 family)